MSPLVGEATKFPLVEYPEEVFNNLSSDQQAMVRIATAVCTGVIPDNLEDYALGKMHNARSITNYFKIDDIFYNLF